MKIFLSLAVSLHLTLALGQTPLTPHLIYSRVEEISRLEKVRPSASPVEIRRSPASDRNSFIAEKAQRILQGGNNIALAVLEDGHLIYEGYARGGNESRRFVSFSMGKSLTALAVGEAYCAGHIKSLDDPASKYNEKIPGNAFGTSSIKKLLMMSSGAITGNHPGFPGMPYPNATHEVLTQQVGTTDLLKKYGDRERSLSGLFAPGTRFNYNNLDTDTLELVVSGATGRSFAEWFEVSIVPKAGLEDISYWGIDRNGQAIASSLYFATLRDWTRIALYLRDIIRSTGNNSCLRAYLGEATRKQISVSENPFGFRGYGYQFWVDNSNAGGKGFWMAGSGGQRIGIDPERDRILITFASSPDPAIYEFFKDWDR